jgi:hypothetical protein
LVVYLSLRHANACPFPSCIFSAHPTPPHPTPSASLNMSYTDALTVIEKLNFRCSAGEFALASGEDVSVARKKLLALGSQVDAKLEITRLEQADVRVEPGSILDPSSYSKKPEPGTVPRERESLSEDDRTRGACVLHGMTCICACFLHGFYFAKPFAIQTCARVCWCAARGMKLPSLSPTHASAASAVANTSESHFDSVFVFPRNSKQLLRNRVLSERVKFLFWAYVWPPLFWVFRASFGLSLLLSMYAGLGGVWGVCSRLPASDLFPLSLSLCFSLSLPLSPFTRFVFPPHVFLFQLVSLSHTHTLALSLSLSLSPPVLTDRSCEASMCPYLPVSSS